MYQKYSGLHDLHMSLNSFLHDPDHKKHWLDTGVAAISRIFL